MLNYKLTKKGVSNDAIVTCMTCGLAILWIFRPFACRLANIVGWNFIAYQNLYRNNPESRTGVF